MPEILGLVTSALGTLRKLKDIADKIKDVEIKSLVADLRLELAEIKERLSEVIDENRTPQATIPALPQLRRACMEGREERSGCDVWGSGRHKTNDEMHCVRVFRE